MKDCRTCMVGVQMGGRGENEKREAPGMISDANINF